MKEVIKMRVNAKSEKFENVTVLGKPMLFTSLRVDKNTVPENLFVYEVRHDDDCTGIPCELAKWVMVNHWGTVISATPVELKETPNNAYRILNEDDWNYEGTTSTLEEYLEREKV